MLNLNEIGSNSDKETKNIFDLLDEAPTISKKQHLENIKSLIAELEGRVKQYASYINSVNAERCE